MFCCSLSNLLCPLWNLIKILYLVSYAKCWVSLEAAQMSTFCGCNSRLIVSVQMKTQSVFEKKKHGLYNPIEKPMLSQDEL